MASGAGARRQNVEPSEKEKANEEAYSVLKELLRLSRKDRAVPYDHVLDTVCQLNAHTVNTADRTILFQIRETLREKLLFYVTLGRHQDIRTVFNNIRNYAQSETPDLEVPTELKPDKPDEWEAFKIEQSAKLQQVPIQQEYAVAPEVVPAYEPEQEPEDVPVNEPVEEPAQKAEDPTDYELHAIRDVLKMPHLIEWDEDNKEDLLTVLKKYQKKLKLAGVKKNHWVYALSGTLTGGALQFYSENIEGQVYDYDEAVAMLRAHYYGTAAVNRYFREWQNLSFAKFREKSSDDEEALAKLYTRVKQLQAILSPDYDGEKYAVKQLLSATEELEVSDVIDVFEPTTVTQTMNLLRKMLQKRPSKTVSRVNFATAFPTQTPYGNQRLQSPRRPSPNQNPGTRRANPKGKDGKTMKCLKCDSEYHLMRHCPKANAADKKEMARVFALATECGMVEIPEEPDPPEKPEATDTDEDEQLVGSMMLLNVLEDRTYAHYHQVDVNVLQQTTEFKGVMIDTGATDSVCGLQQYKAYHEHQGLKVPAIKPLTMHTSISGADNYALDPIGHQSVRIPLQDSLFFILTMLIVNNDVPMVMGNEDIEHYDCEVKSKARALYCRTLDITIPLEKREKHLWLTWSKYEVMYTKAELQKFHKAFGHVSADRIVDIFKRADPDADVTEDRKILQDIQERCSTCQFYGPKLTSPSVAAPANCVFNHTVQVDLLKIDEKDVFHVVCLGTNLQSAKFIPDKSSKTVWNAFLTSWGNLYNGLPDVIHHDAGSEFIGSFFKNQAETNGIELKVAGVEAHHSIGKVERYHQPLRTIFMKLKNDLDQQVSDAVTLSQAVRAINDTAGPDGLVPVLLVFGTIPRFNFHCGDRHDRTNEQRLQALLKARGEYSQIVNRMKLQMAGQRRTPAHRQLRPNVPVLVLRERGPGRSSHWTGPHVLKEVKENMAHVYTSTQEATAFPVSAVKPFFVPDQEECVEVMSHDVVQDPNDHRFDDAKVKEVEGLLEQGVFEATDETHSSLPVLGSRFVLTVKDAGTQNQRFKARLVVQGFKDPDKLYLLHNAPTIRVYNLRLLISIATAMGWTIIIGDVPQAYIKADRLRRQLRIKLPADLPAGIYGFVARQIVLLSKPLYGLPDSGSYWFDRLQAAFRKWGFTAFTTDKCLLYRRNEQGDFAILVATHVDDIIVAGEDAAIDSLRCQLEAEFNIKWSAKPLMYTGTRITDDGTTRKLDQHSYIEKVLQSESNFARFRGQLAWMASNTRPDLAYVAAKMSQMNPDTHPRECGAVRRKVTKHLKATQEQCLTFPPLDLNSVQLIVYADASHKYDHDNAQCGFVILLLDAEKRCNVIHWSSAKPRRVTKSTLSAELSAFSSASDMSSMMKIELQELFNRTIDLLVFTDSESLFNLITSTKITTEKRLMFEVSAIREQFDQFDITNVAWINSEFNIADPLTKLCQNTFLTDAMNGRLEHRVAQWLTTFIDDPNDVDQ